MLIANLREILAGPFNMTTLEEADDITLEQERTFIENHRERDGWIAIVAEVDRRVVGMLNFENGGRTRIAHRGSFGMSVIPAWQGRGVGEALLVALLDWARAHPLVEKVILVVVVGNDRAINLYRKHGFTVCGRNPREIKYGENEYSDDLVMYRYV